MLSGGMASHRLSTLEKGGKLSAYVAIRKEARNVNGSTRHSTRALRHEGDSVEVHEAPAEAAAMAGRLAVIVL